MIEVLCWLLAVVGWCLIGVSLFWMFIEVTRKEKDDEQPLEGFVAGIDYDLEIS